MNVRWDRPRCSSDFDYVDVLLNCSKKLAKPSSSHGQVSHSKAMSWKNGKAPHLGSMVGRAEVKAEGRLLPGPDG